MKNENNLAMLIKVNLSDVINKDLFVLINVAGKGGFGKVWKV